MEKFKYLLILFVMLVPFVCGIYQADYFVPSNFWLVLSLIINVVILIILYFFIISFAKEHPDKTEQNITEVKPNIFREVFGRLVALLLIYGYLYVYICLGVGSGICLIIGIVTANKYKIINIYSNSYAKHPGLYAVVKPVSNISTSLNLEDINLVKYTHARQFKAKQTVEIQLLVSPLGYRVNSLSPTDK